MPIYFVNTHGNIRNKEKDKCPLGNRKAEECLDCEYLFGIDSLLGKPTKILCNAPPKKQIEDEIENIILIKEKQ